MKWVSQKELYKKSATFRKRRSEIMKKYYQRHKEEIQKQQKEYRKKIKNDKSITI